MRYVAHLADRDTADSPTACGAKWQAWQRPRGIAAADSEPPYAAPGPRTEVGLCEDCRGKAVGVAS